MACFLGSVSQRWASARRAVARYRYLPQLNKGKASALAAIGISSYLLSSNCSLSFFAHAEADPASSSSSSSTSSSPSSSFNTSLPPISTDPKRVSTKKWKYYTGKTIDPDAISSGDFHLFAGNANPELAGEIAKYLGAPLSKANIGKFNDGETSISIGENVRESHCFIVQPISYPASDNLVELLLLISTLRRASAREITAIIPYYGYSRQDRKMTSRVPIAAADLALMLEEMGVDRVVSIDLHAGQIQGFFGASTPVENLEAGPVASSYFGEQELHSPVIVSPDANGVPRAKSFRNGLALQYPDADLAMLIEEERERDMAGRLQDKGVGNMMLVGDVKGRDVILCEDIIDSGYTISHAAAELKERFGAARIFGFATHGLFMGGGPSARVALDRIENSPIDQLIVTDTVPLTPETRKIDKLKQLTLAPLIAESIRRIYEQQSLSAIQDRKEASNSSSNITKPPSS